LCALWNKGGGVHGGREHIRVRVYGKGYDDLPLVLVRHRIRPARPFQTDGSESWATILHQNKAFGPQHTTTERPASLRELDLEESISIPYGIVPRSEVCWQLAGGYCASDMKARTGSKKSIHRENQCRWIAGLISEAGGGSHRLLASGNLLRSGVVEHLVHTDYCCRLLLVGV